MRGKPFGFSISLNPSGSYVELIDENGITRFGPERSKFSGGIFSVEANKLRVAHQGLKNILNKARELKKK